MPEHVGCLCLIPGGRFEGAQKQTALGIAQVQFIACRNERGMHLADRPVSYID